MNGGQAIVKTLIKHGMTHTSGSPKASIIEVLFEKEEDYMPTKQKVAEKDFTM